MITIEQRERWASKANLLKRDLMKFVRQPKYSGIIIKDDKSFSNNGRLNALFNFSNFLNDNIYFPKSASSFTTISVIIITSIR